MARPRLQPGENTTATSKIAHLEDGRVSMQWRLCLPNGQVKRFVTEGKAGTTNGELRRRARATAARLMAGVSLGEWRSDSSMSRYIDEECIPAIQNNNFTKQLRPNTQLRYIHVLELFRDQCGPIPIADAVRPRALKETFAAIAIENGTASARQAVKVTSKYVMRRLVSDEVIAHNPLRDLDIELPEHIAKPKPTGGQALDPEERARVVDYLLELDPSVPKGKRGRYTADQRTARRQLVIDVTLTQASTGLRISEVTHLTCEDVIEDKDSGTLALIVREHVSKTHRGRTVPVTDERVAERIRERASEAAERSSRLVFVAPAADSVWDGSNAQKAVRELYDELADELDIPLLRKVSSHVWRATLNTELMRKGMPAELRAAYFGHSAEMNRSAYTDTTGTAPIADWLRR